MLCVFVVRCSRSNESCSPPAVHLGAAAVVPIAGKGITRLNWRRTGGNSEPGALWGAVSSHAPVMCAGGWCQAADETVPRCTGERGTGHSPTGRLPTTRPITTRVIRAPEHPSRHLPAVAGRSNVAATGVGNERLHSQARVSLEVGDAQSPAAHSPPTKARLWMVRLALTLRICRGSGQSPSRRRIFDLHHQLTDGIVSPIVKLEAAAAFHLHRVIIELDLKAQPGHFL